MKLKLLFVCISILHAVLVLASDDSTNIIVHKDGRIQKLLNKVDVHAVPPTGSRPAMQKGYRIMVYNTNDRELAYKTKGQLLARFPEQAVYMSYQAPFFKLKFGDFLSRGDAETASKKVAAITGKSVFIVPGMVVVKLGDVPVKK